MRINYDNVVIYRLKNDSWVGVESLTCVLAYSPTTLHYTHTPPRPAGILTESDVTFASLTLQAGREYVGVCVYPFFLLFAIVVWLVAVWITTTFCLEVFVLFVPHVLLPERV